MDILFLLSPIMLILEESFRFNFISTFPKYNFLNDFTGFKDDDMDFQKVFYDLFDRISFKFARYLEPQSYLVVRRTNMQMLKNSQRG